MGHKSGYKHSGAVGKAVPMKRSEAKELLDPGSEDEVRAAARAHAEKAIRLLAKAVGRRGNDPAPWSVARAAANDLLEWGYGKPATQEPGEKEGGLTVVINQLTTGEHREITIPDIEIRRGEISAQVEKTAEEE